MASCVRGFHRNQSDALPSLTDLLQIAVFSVKIGLLPVAGRGLLCERSHVLVREIPPLRTV
jgi:hypothetical protein